VPREHLKEMMAFEADRITGLVLTDEVVRPELNVVLEEQNMRVANNPNSRLAEQMDAALYLNHPYGRPTIGWRPEIESLDRDDALAFYRRFYTPNNAIVVIAGDVDPPRRSEPTPRKLTARSSPRAEISPRQRPKEPPQEAPRTVTLADSRVEQPSVNRYYLAPSRTTANPGESEALEVLAHVLGTGANSRLYRDASGRSGRGAQCRRLLFGHSTRLWQARASTARRIRERSLHDVEVAIDAVLADVSEHGITADELDLAKNRLIADAVYAQDNQATLARWYGSALATGETVDMVRDWPEAKFAPSAPTAVREAARTVDQSRRASVTGYLVNSLQVRGEALVNTMVPAFSRYIQRGVAVAIASASSFRRAGPRHDHRARGQSMAASKPGWCASRRSR
jgi:zinc protease